MFITSFILALLFLIFFVSHLAASEGTTRRWLGVLAIGTLIVFCLFSLIKYQRGENLENGTWKMNLRYGLDIQGGTQFVVELGGEPTASVRDQAVSVIRSRIDGLGLTEPLIQPSGNNRIIVQIPGVSEKEKTVYRGQLERVAKLEFRIVHPESERIVRAIGRGEAAMDTIPLDYEEIPWVQSQIEGDASIKTLLVKRRVEMSGKYVDMAYRSVDALGRPVVILRFTPQGEELFAKITRENKGERLAIILDGEVYSAPVIRMEIQGNCEISGGKMTPQAAEELANILQNPLETPVRILDERSVDPSLGKSSIESGFRAALIALLLIIVFMVLYYRIAGIVSVIALCVNMLLLVGLLAQFGFTLTMPGLAGIILTFGMAVDANVLIYERLREELAHGKTLGVALGTAFTKAFSSILDANVTTIIAAIILFWQGTGAVQGFAVTLVLGVISSVFSAMVVTRVIFDGLLAKRKLKSLTMGQWLAKVPNIDFMSYRWIALGASAVCLVICIFYGFNKGNAIYGVDFTGGSMLTYTFQKKLSDKEITNAVPRVELFVQYMRGEGDSEVLVLRAPSGKADEVHQALTSHFPQAGLEQIALENVESVIGKEMQQKALVALALGLIGIFLYTAWRFEPSFAFGAVVAILHDVALSIGLYILLGRQLSLPVVGAILTVAGYSINDTIVIFDRIREGLHHRAKGLKDSRLSLMQIMNLAINQTLSRTLITSGTTFVATLALFLFGGRVINDFALILLIGIVVGTYSSIFIASPIALLLAHADEKKRKKALATGSIATT